MPLTKKAKRLARVGVKVKASLKSSRKSALKLDPTRTIGLRKAFVRELRKRFATIRRNIRLKIIDGDALGLRPLTNAFCPTGPGGGVDPSCGRLADAVDALPQKRGYGKDSREHGFPV